MVRTERKSEEPWQPNTTLSTSYRALLGVEYLLEVSLVPGGSGRRQASYSTRRNLEPAMLLKIIWILPSKKERR